MLEFIWRPIYQLWITRQRLQSYKYNFPNPTMFDPPTNIETFEHYLDRQIESWYKVESEYLTRTISAILTMYKIPEDKLEPISTHISRDLIAESIKQVMIRGEI